MKRIKSKFQSIYAKTAICLIAILCTSFFLINMISISFFEDDLEKMAINNEQTQMQSSIGQIEYLFMDIINQAKTLYSQEDIYDLLFKNKLEEKDINRLEIYFKTILYSSSGNIIHQIRIINPESNQCFLIGRSENVVVTDFVDEDSDYLIDTTSFYIRPCEYDATNRQSGAKSYSIIMRIKNHSDYNSIAAQYLWIFFDLDREQFRQIIFNPADNGFLSFLEYRDAHDYQDLVMISSGEYNNAYEPTVQDVRSLCSQLGYAEIDPNTYVFGKAFSIESQQFYLAKFVPRKTVFQYTVERLNTSREGFLVICILSCVAMLGMEYYFLAPLGKMDLYLQQIARTRDFSLRLGEKNIHSGDDEIGRLIEQTDHLLDVINEQFRNQDILYRKQRQTESKMLQAQINPHFMFNALQSISSLALQNGQEDIYQYITLLGQQMHYSMSLNDIVTIRQELEYIDGYLQLQSIRFGRDIVIREDIAEKLYELNIPKMSLQPFIENAYKHGKIFQIKEQPMVYVKISLEQNEQCGMNLIIVVQDNGVGASEAKLREINDNVSNFQNDGVDHIGIVNVYQRMRLFFNKEVTLVVDYAKPEEKRGFCVKLVIKDFEIELKQ